MIPPLRVLTPEDPAGVSGAKQLPRVLHVINGEHYSGAERVQDLLALRLPDHGFEAGFVALKPGRFGSCRRSVDTPLEELAMRSRWDLRAVGRVARAAQAGGYQIIHAHTPRSAMVAALAARQLELPFVYHVHSPTSRDSTRWLANLVNGRIERLSIAGAAKLITVSPTLTDHMKSLGVPDERLRCVLNGVPKVAGAEPRKKREGVWTLGMVALFRPRKGAEVLLEALALLKSKGQDVRLSAIGPFETPDYEEHLVSLAGRLGVGNSVSWIGFTEGVGAELDRVDALVLPSLFGEGLPMVVLEAMAAGLPVIATHCEGTAEAVAHRETGYLVEPSSVSQLAGAIDSLLTGELDYEQASARSIARHAERFSDDAMAAQVAEVYRELLGLPDARAESIADGLHPSEAPV
ncbi:glycosyltransferase [Posidoniimonas polymericola]|nr:glycosyltransferase [Posidoniimonas polymericola]